MEPELTPNLFTDREHEIYARGWRDGIARLASVAGSTRSVKKSAAARRNGCKGGKPKGLASFPHAVLDSARKNPGMKITIERSDLRFLD